MMPRIAAAMLGVWLTAAPDVLGYHGVAATNDRVVGPLVTSVALVAMWEVVRSLRWVNALLGAWLLVAPFVFGYGGLPRAQSVGLGLGLIGLATIRGRLKHRYGGGWQALLERSIRPT